MQREISPPVIHIRKLAVKKIFRSSALQYRIMNEMMMILMKYQE